jgi:hypothetical protein
MRFNKYEKVLVAARGHPIFPDYNPTTAGKYGKTEASLNYPFLKFKDGSEKIVPPRDAKGLVRDLVRQELGGGGWSREPVLSRQIKGHEQYFKDSAGQYREIEEEERAEKRNKKR